MRKMGKSTSKNGLGGSVLICCLDSDYKTILYMCGKIKTSLRYIVKGERQITSWIENQGGAPIHENTLKILEDSKLTDIPDTTRIVTSDIHDFDKMMYTLRTIIEKELRNGNEVYLSIATGTGEYCAAASILGMSYENVNVVSKRTIENPIVDGQIDARIGNTIFTSESDNVSKIEGIEIDLPDQDLIFALAIFDKIPKAERKTMKVIWRLIEEKVWFPLKFMDVPNDGVSGTSYPFKDVRMKNDDQKRMIYKEKNHYNRNILKKWVDKGWVEKHDGAVSGFEVTDEGRRMISVFTGDGGDLNIETLTNEEKDRKREKDNEEFGEKFLEKFGNKENGDY